MADPIRRQRRLRATTVVEDDNCDECGHPDSRHYVDGSCELCSRCDALDDQDDRIVPDGFTEGLGFVV